MTLRQDLDLRLAGIETVARVRGIHTVEHLLRELVDFIPTSKPGRAVAVDALTTYISDVPRRHGAAITARYVLNALDLAEHRNSLENLAAAPTTSEHLRSIVESMLGAEGPKWIQQRNFRTVGSTWSPVDELAERLMAIEAVEHCASQAVKDHMQVGLVRFLHTDRTERGHVVSVLLGYLEAYPYRKGAAVTVSNVLYTLEWPELRSGLQNLYETTAHKRPRRQARSMLGAKPRPLKIPPDWDRSQA